MPIKIQFTTYALTAALAFAGGAHAAPASSSAATEPTSVRVSVADLDLHKDAGAKVALRRIHRAAVVICGDEPLSSGLHRHAVYEGCVKTTVRTALASGGSQLAGGPPSVETILAANR